MAMPPELRHKIMVDFQQREGTKSLINHFRGINKHILAQVDYILQKGICSHYPLGLVLQIHKHIPTLRAKATEVRIRESIHKLHTNPTEHNMAILVHYYRYITDHYGYTDNTIEQLHGAMYDALKTSYIRIFSIESRNDRQLLNRLLFVALATRYMELHIPIQGFQSQYYQITIATVDREFIWRPAIGRDVIDVVSGLISDPSSYTRTGTIDPVYNQLARNMISNETQPIVSAKIHHITPAAITPELEIDFSKVPAVEFS